MRNIALGRISVTTPSICKGSSLVKKISILCTLLGYPQNVATYCYIEHDIGTDGIQGKIETIENCISK